MKQSIKQDKMIHFRESLRKFEDMHREAIGYINLNPIQRGGILTPEEIKPLIEPFIGRERGCCW